VLRVVVVVDASRAVGATVAYAPVAGAPNVSMPCVGRADVGARDAGRWEERGRGTSKDQDSRRQEGV
jgi:hypothetical protein